MSLYWTGPDRDGAHRTFFKHDLPTRLDRKRIRTKAADQHWREVCREVDIRDGNACRACKRRVVTTLTVQDDRRERHHIIPRSLGGVDESFNILTTCKTCHDLRHVKRTLSMSGDANGLVTFSDGSRTWRG